MPKVSVIIPCYNLGRYIEAAIDSILASNFKDLEIVVVNDGSTDQYTNELLYNLKKQKTKIITTYNQGVSEARNVAIKASKGEYILPLDADDVVYPEYITKAVKLLDNHPSTGIVYAKGEFFGLRNGIWELPNYSLKSMLNDNCIPVCGMFRRSDYDKTKGYNPNMIYGYEDWDFWLSLLELGVKVKKIDEALFGYRQVRESRTSAICGKKEASYLQLIQNHLKFYNDNVWLLSRPMFHLFLSRKNRKQLKKIKHRNKLITVFVAIKWLPCDIIQLLKIYLMFPVYVYRIYKLIKY